MRSLLALSLLLLACGSVRADTPPLTPDERRVPPPPGEARQAPAAPARELRLPNGIRLVLVEVPRAALATVRVVFPSAGDALDPEGTPVATVVSQVLAEGTAAHPGGEWRKAVERAGAAIGFVPGADAMTLKISCLPKSIEKAFALAKEAVEQPELSEESLARQKTAVVSAIAQNRTDPEKAGKQAVLSALLGRHPYADAPMPERVAGLSRAEVKSFVESRLRPSAVVAVGSGEDIERMRDAAERSFGTLPAASQTAGLAAVPEFRARSVEAPLRAGGERLDPAAWRIRIVDLKGSPRAVVFAGVPGLTRGDPDYPEFVAMRLMLGGGELGLLNEEIRVRQKLSYYALTLHERWTKGGVLVARTDVEPANALQAVKAIGAVMERMVNGPSPQQRQEWESRLAAIKEQTAGSLLAASADADSRAADIEAQLLAGLPPAEAQAFVGRLRAVTLDGALAAARKYLRQPNIAVVVAADAYRAPAGGESVHAQLSRLAPVEVVGPDGSPSS